MPTDEVLLNACYRYILSKPCQQVSSVLRPDSVTKEELILVQRSLLEMGQLRELFRNLVLRH
jgi:hypothetical protein